jgi:diacyltrehalose acyltransferase
MTPWTARGLGLGLLAGACACLNAAPAWADDAATLPPDYTALVLGHAFLPQPDATYMQEVIDTYVHPTSTFTGEPTYNIVGSPVSVFTPETDYASGLTQGVTELDQAITQQLTANPDADLVIAGYSMSTAIQTQEMINLASAAGGAPDTDGLKFVLAEDLNSPDGGIFTRLPGIGGVTLPPTPADTPYTTDIYSIEYSGASDFPQYANNIYADLNAVDGYIDLHPYLLTGWPAYFNPAELAGAVAQPTSDADVATSYFLIPTQDLPLLEGLRDAPGAPSVLADLIQPDMRVLVDLGYNWTGDADVVTPAQYTSPDIDTTAVDSYLAAGADQGMIASLVDMGILPQSDLAGLSDLYPYVPDVSDLQTGALTNDAMAALDATASLNALTADLASSSSPLASELSAYLPSVATELADFFQNAAGLLSF